VSHERIIKFNPQITKKVGKQEISSKRAGIVRSWTGVEKE